MTTATYTLKGLTHDDLREWAGSKTFNRGKSYLSHVYDLSQRKDGTFVAQVSGTHEYATSVKYRGKRKFAYSGNCPFGGGPCKHVVAVLLAAAEQIKQKQEIPPLDEDDELYLESLQKEDGDEDYSEKAFRPKSEKNHTAKIEKLLAERSHDELKRMLLEIATEFPEVSLHLLNTVQMEKGDTAKLVRSLKKQIRRIAAEDAWYNSWTGEGNLPNYSHIEKQLQQMLAAGHADAVLELGNTLWESGNQQVEQSSDEGETANEIASCLGVVLQALPATSLPPANQLLWVIEHSLQDQFDLIAGADDILKKSRYSQEHWHEVAAELERQLASIKTTKSDNFHASYQRNRVMESLHHAYQKSGQKNRMIPLLEKEAEHCQSYDLLVKTLLESGEREKAREWCIRGYKKTIKSAPGIASKLQDELRQLAAKEKRFDLVAAYRASDFFEHPSEETFKELNKASAKIQQWPAVREGILAFLQSGKIPAAGKPEWKNWPLPEPEVKPADQPRLKIFPNREMQIRIALLEKRHDDAVSTYQALTKTKLWRISIDEEIAAAVAHTHPDISLQIWNSRAVYLIEQTKPVYYEEAAKYLRKMKEVFRRTNRLQEWNPLLARLRQQHKAKRKLLEILDNLEKPQKLTG